MEQIRKCKRLAKSKLAFGMIMFFLFLFATINTSSCNIILNDNSKLDSIEMITMDSLYIDSLEKIKAKEQLRIQIINEVDSYIKNKTKKAHIQLPEYIANIGLDNDIDICFIMAQTELETNYGTLGAGRSTSRRSLFGIYGKRYHNYEDACEDYINILNKYYLVNGKSEYHLMKKYVTKSGKRYASNPNYEAELRSKYYYIKKTTNIYDLHQMYKENI